MARWCTPAGARMAFLALILASIVAPSGAARKHNMVRPSAETSQPGRLASGYGRPAGVVTPSTDPAKLLTPQEWRQYVRTELPRLGKVDPGPFAVWQNRRFERGETIVPPSTNTF